MTQPEYEYRTISVNLTMPDLDAASRWEFSPDTSRTDGYSVIGQDEDGPRVLVEYDSFFGASSDELTEEGVPSEWIMDRPKAEELHDRIQQMDEIYFPGFNPTLVRVENHQVVERFYPPEVETAPKD